MSQAETIASQSGPPPLLPLARAISLEVTYTKHVTQRNKRFQDGRLSISVDKLAKLEDVRSGLTVSSSDLKSVLGFLDRWNAAWSQGTDLTILKGFQGLLVYVPQVPHPIL